MDKLKQMQLIRLDRISIELLHMMRESSAESTDKALSAIGQIKADMVGCGCNRPNSCSECRTEIEDSLYWDEKSDEILQEVLRGAKDEYDQYLD